MSANVYAGSLKPKKKAELVDIANALSLPAAGTKDDLETRIREHLDANETTLSDSASFSGLYPRRKRTVASTITPAESPSDDEHTPPPRAGGRKESRGAVALRSKDTAVVHSLAPPFDPTTLPPLPPSPVRSILNDAIAAAPDAPAAVAQMVRTSELAQGSEVFLANLRTVVSSSANIATLTVLAELLMLVAAIVPWRFLHVPLTPPFTAAASAVVLHVPYAPLAYVLSGAPWALAARWAVGALVLPQLAGALVCFAEPRRAVDPLSAAIVRVACAVGGRWGVPDAALGQGWRVLAASVGAAFALAEAVERRAPAPAKRARKSLANAL